MDQGYRGCMRIKRDLKVWNQKEERDLQHKLNMLDKQFQNTRRMLQQRRDSVRNQQRRVVMLKVCEPKATVNIAMREIWEFKNTDTHFRGLQTSDSRRFYASKVKHPGEPSRSISAPPVSDKNGSERHRGNIQSSLSIRQIKNIATIDSISEKELARRQQHAREEIKRLRQFQRETLHCRVAAFIETLKDKSNMQRHMEPP